MKDFANSPGQAVKEFYTAREIAEIAKDRGISNFPHTKRGVQVFAERNGWAEFGERLCRKRAGRGGGLEYHFTLMPDRLVMALHRRFVREDRTQKLQEAGAIEKRKMAALMVAALGAHPRAVMAARAEILSSIEGYAIANGNRRSWAIKRFIEAQEQFARRQEIEKKREQGHFLTVEEVSSLGVPLLLSVDDGFQVDPSLLATANDRGSRAKISRTTLYDWFKARDTRGVLALAPEPPKVSEPIPAAFHDFMKFYAVPSKPSIAQAHADYLKAVAKREDVQPMTLSLDQVTRILRERLNNIEKNVGREGILTLRARLPYITRTTDDMWPTTIYTADGKTFDAEIADPVSRKPMRPEITSVLDVATRKCVGFAVSRKENVIAVTEALRRSCSAHGICAIFYTDRGAGYKNKTFDADVGGLMGRLGITKMHALPYNSQAKGIIERFNHVWNDLARRMPTYIGRDMDKEAKQAIHRETRHDIVEFGAARRLPSWSEFITAVEATIEDYNDRPHSGLPRFEDPSTGHLRHMTPNEAWDLHVAKGFQAVSIDPDAEDDLFRPYVMRTVQRAQVDWNTNTYFHEALEGYHKEKVLVGYDLHQADKVWVREFDVSTGQPGKLICVAIYMGNAQRYVPLTVEQKAIEDRNKNAMKLLDRRRRDKAAELGDPLLLEHEPLEPAPFLEVVPDQPQPVTLTEEGSLEAVKEPTASPPRRRTFATDEELAAWALEHPGDLSPNQIRVLKDCMKNPEARRYFEMSGIDTEALRTLLRAAA